MIEALARHPDMQAADRQKRGRAKANVSSTSQMLAAHPNFMNEPEHVPARRRAFEILIGPGISRLKALVSEITARNAMWLEDGQVDLIAGFTKRIASEVWSHLLTGGPEHADTLAQSSKTIAKLMAFEASETDIKQAEVGSDVLMDWAREFLTGDVQGLAAAMTFDAIDGAAGMAGNAIWLLTCRPDLWDALCRNQEMVTSYALEVERLYPPVLGLERSAVRTLILQGQEIPKGTNVLFLNCVGNRDPQVYATPNDVELYEPVPRSLSFGMGPRSCAGRMLARLVTEAAILALLRKCQKIDVGEPVDWGPPGQLKAVQSLICNLRLRRCLRSFTTVAHHLKTTNQ